MAPSLTGDRCSLVGPKSDRCGAGRAFGSLGRVVLAGLGGRPWQPWGPHSKVPESALAPASYRDSPLTPSWPWPPSPGGGVTQVVRSGRLTSAIRAGWSISLSLQSLGDRGLVSDYAI